MPIVLTCYYSIKRKNNEIALSFLVIASLFFYGYWEPKYLILILSSVLFNFLIGKKLNSGNNKTLLFFGVASNLFLLGYYKYTDFLLNNLNSIFHLDISLQNIVLPLAMSFFTFQQIAFLVDSYRGETRDYNFGHYMLFVSFFPQLIAGPIVHHKELIPQLTKLNKNIDFDKVSKGIAIFTLGLFKKVMLADQLSIVANRLFSGTQVESLTTLNAWAGSLSYTFQLYFDFSGYSDMAIGLGLLFGVVLPINFNSPYKSTSIIEFWRRWHITLSHFLRDYLYISLGGNRSGKTRKYLNLFLTMLLGGLWHGAGWTFVAWGALHGSYLIINHFFRYLQNKFNFKLPKLLSLLITFLSVVIAWVYFRAQNIEQAHQILTRMFMYFETTDYIFKNSQLNLIFIAGFISFALPNTQDLILNNKKVFKIQFNQNTACSIVISLLLITTIYSMIGSVSEFLYFQF
jgi:D-alanyl-lipoteichoic acid acyltransferase DltB (MBOAT superfamily)